MLKQDIQDLDDEPEHLQLDQIEPNPIFGITVNDLYEANQQYKNKIDKLKKLYKIEDYACDIVKSVIDNAKQIIMDKPSAKSMKEVCNYAH